MNSKNSYCLGERHFSQTINQNGCKKIKPKTKKLVNFAKRKCNICGRNKSPVFTKWMNEGQDFEKRTKCKHGHCTTLSNATRSNLNSKVFILKLLDKCPNSREVKTNYVYSEAIAAWR